MKFSSLQSRNYKRTKQQFFLPTKQFQKKKIEAFFTRSHGDKNKCYDIHVFNGNNKKNEYKTHHK